MFVFFIFTGMVSICLIFAKTWQPFLRVWIICIPWKSAGDVRPVYIFTVFAILEVLILPILMYLIVLVYISLLTNDIKHLSIAYLPPLVFLYFCPLWPILAFLVGLYVFWGTNSSPGNHALSIFSLPVAYHFISLAVFFLWNTSFRFWSSLFLSICWAITPSDIWLFVV